MTILNTGQNEYTITTQKFADINRRHHGLIDTIITINHTSTDEMDLPEYRVTLIKKGEEYNETSRSQRISTILSIDRDTYPDFNLISESFESFLTEGTLLPIAKFLSEYARLN